MARKATNVAPPAPKRGKSKPPRSRTSREVDPDVARLMGAERLWGEGQVRVFERTPEDDYDAFVKDFSIDDSGNCALQFVVQGIDPDTGEEKTYYPRRRYDFDRNGEANAYAVGDMKTDMARTNFEPPPDNAPLVEIASAAVQWGKSLKGQTIRIRVRHNADKQGRIDDLTGETRVYENVYPLRLVA